MAKVCLSKISKRFGEREILKNIDLEIQDGIFCVLVGASGCGKSTLLRLIAGLETPTSGEIYINDKSVNNVHPKDRDIAMVFQNYALYPHLNVKDNIALGLKVRNVAKCEIERRVKRAAEILKLEDYLNAKPKELSGGQRQRVALARAIVREAKVFLMDEPLSNLDAKLRNEMRSEIKKLHKKLKTTFIYVTHDQTEALTMGDKICVLNDGLIQQFDNAQNIYDHPKNIFVASFMGQNPMNITEATIKNGFMLFGNVTVELSLLSIKCVNLKKIYIGIRPENIIHSSNPIYHYNPIKFSAEVTFEENLGTYKNIYFKVGNSEFCSIIGANVPIEKTMNFSIHPSSINLFDYETKSLIDLPKRV